MENVSKALEKLYYHRDRAISQLVNAPINAEILLRVSQTSDAITALEALTPKKSATKKKAD